MSRLHVLKPAQSLASQLLPTSSAPGVLPEHVQAFAASLTSIHGAIRIANESSGLHFYLACPQCLQTDGESELFKKHLAVNIDKFFAGKQNSVLCMKCGFFCNAVDLQFMPPLKDRGIEHKAEMVKSSGPKADYLETDERGNLVPKNPGTLIPVTQLPADHPAIEYLNLRKFRPDDLWNQFQCSWCEEENQNLYYRRQPGGFRTTSQGRLIFFCLQGGVKVGWQARILEFDDGDKRFFWHPYKKDWVHVLTNENGKWTPREGYEEWDPAKYWTAPGTRRNNVVMGFDAALAWNLKHNRMRQHQRVALLVEGPLDGGRLGPPAVIVMGKYLTADQAKLLADTFYRLIAITDNDAGGKKLQESVQKHLSTKEVRFDFMNVPGAFKDPGSLDPLNALMFSRMALNRADRL